MVRDIERNHRYMVHPLMKRNGPVLLGSNNYCWAEPSDSWHLRTAMTTTTAGTAVMLNGASTRGKENLEELL